jgi:sialate O-acetylesterase
MIGHNLKILAMLCVMPTWALAEVTLPSIFADHMVLQRNTPVPVWGKAARGEQVTIAIAGQSISTNANLNGEWMVKLAPMVPQAEPLSMTVTGSDEIPKTINDILIGDVWVCSGQSNMDFALRHSINGAQEVLDSENPRLRLFKFPHTVSVQPSREIKGTWQTCTPKTAADFSAVAYFFGRQIAKDEEVAIGLIQNAWGGMPAEAFTSKETLESDRDFKPLLDQKAAASVGAAEKKKVYEAELARWNEQHMVKDPGNKGAARGWADRDFDDSAWKKMKAPAKWESTGLKIDGAVWFRKTIDIPVEWWGQELTLSLGILDDFDATYFNGKEIGATPPENKFAWATQRNYTIPADTVKPGKAVIAVRIFDQWGEGGFSSGADELVLAVKDHERNMRIPLSGQWSYEVEYSVPQPDKLPLPPAAPPSPEAPSAASNLFNGMVNPLIPYAITGAIWYQGESNASRAEQYRKLFPAMIADWRQHWGQGEFPFLFVQLANFKARTDEPSESEWAELREAQLFALNKPKTGMAVIIDIGDAHDIHPKNKQDVGRRLALAAQHVAYRKSIEYSGPMYESMQIEADRIRVHFTHAAGLKTKDGGPIKGFAIAGADRKFVWAQAKIKGDEVLVWADGIDRPVAVRYAWADNPDCNLHNGADLPASPFRTDDWKGITAGIETPRVKPKAAAAQTR